MDLRMVLTFVQAHMVLVSILPADHECMIPLTHIVTVDYSDYIYPFRARIRYGETLLRLFRMRSEKPTLSVFKPDARSISSPFVPLLPLPL
ncbi:hypothetical protein M378DRAFT_160652 [Amanita muscaria Koide BX008]|uniref:Uncharacterized protein n=1 Tax=Amanita muscaria (strain Koide BX008) TaxID=946122 RepID=A0A0C2WXW0_AMAMK|nr:hypothetical protein M378DRAFT_160652 [Amanita muscaria Koide BX008]